MAVFFLYSPLHIWLKFRLEALWGCKAAAQYLTKITADTIRLDDVVRGIPIFIEWKEELNMKTEMREG